MQAEAQQESFPAYLQLVAAHARAEGVSEGTIAGVLSGLTPNQRVIDLDTAQPGRQAGPPPMAPYIARHVGSSIISRGRARYAALSSILPDIERRYGVPAPVLFAIWGHETNFGGYTGDFDLARSLATLAWEGRRRELFEGELIALMKMVDRGVPRDELKGSWAGAFGYPQFLPSVYLRLAVDGNSDGKVDIFTAPDAIASIANYFRDAGWRQGQPWGVRAAVPSSFDVDAYATKLSAPSCGRVHARHSQWKTVAEWRALGVSALEPIGSDVLVSLFQPDGPGTPAYLLTGNYRVILQYNCSNYYALSVGLLADEIAR
ncbi:lytic murein transglycosylase [Novosphingobium mangrovi (ex Huang et al. 2023)]|uniref:Lytic murein transglycosylase n=1 Tax=Novosphingobium mangrovi (ex Huang et al. 2023) TaxID=2976432 RepID=A0ABT2I7K7_9SPHN|nr:lytic murein transglycosylase [Novosphingobium mangrovi (ex Huang et al. 2023)]MCT2400791.1 lytic murein transglycosylase [Novosphingobium mangrovi (ex Huang et al. 2023)]